GGVNELAQRISGQRMIVATGIHIVELACLVVATFRVHTLKEKAFNFIRCIEGVALFLVQSGGIELEDPADVAHIRRAVLVNYIAKNQHFPWTKDVCRSPIE